MVHILNKYLKGVFQNANFTRDILKLVALISIYLLHVIILK